MTFDMGKEIGAVTREVSRREHHGKPAKVVVASRNFDTPRADLWDAITNLQRVPRWFLPVTGDLRLGGSYQFAGNAGGNIMACQPPQRLEVTWEFGGSVTWLTLTLDESVPDLTHLRLEHVAHEGDDLWDQFGPGAVGVGWDQALLGLARYVDGASRLSREEAAAWLASQEGKGFVRLASQEWARASVASGTEEELAKAAEHRTTAFYTGEGQG